jgi:hypothetical protein
MNKTDLLNAIELALDGNWDDAHRIVQAYDDEYAAWIHAVLHKIEGDEGNSRYWYGRAGRTFQRDIAHADELNHIREELE